jgi:hypothetical protein
MGATVAQLAERVLRRLGVAIVPVADRPRLDTRISPATIATNALIQLGVLAVDKPPVSQAVVVPIDNIATLALIKLGVIASDETPIASDMTFARDAVNAVHANLVAQGHADWASTAITNAVSEEYAALVAIHLAASFGKAADIQNAAVLEARIAAVSRAIRAQALALSKVSEIQASLTSQGSVFWDNTGIPTSVAEEYTRLTALSLAQSFGQQVDPKMLLVFEERVKRASRIYRAPEDAQEAVMSVHDSLVARGLARWSVFDIHAAAEMPYEMIAANRLAPLYDVRVDPGAEALATRQLAQIVALGSSGERVRVEYF